MGWTMVGATCDEGFHPVAPTGEGDEGEHACTPCEEDLDCEACDGAPIYEWVGGEWVIVNDCDCEGTLVEPEAPGTAEGQQACGSCEEDPPEPGVETECCPGVEIPATLTCAITGDFSTGPFAVHHIGSGLWTGQVTCGECTITTNLQCLGGLWSASIAAFSGPGDCSFCSSSLMPGVTCGPPFFASGGGFLAGCPCGSNVTASWTVPV